MTPETSSANPDVLRRRALSLLDEALDLEPAHRAAFLDRVSAGNPALRRELDSLLEASAAADGFLESPDFSRSLAALPPPSRAGDRVGAYRLVREVGRGGMGTVYLAERADPEFEQQVALKIMSTGVPAANLLERFQQERQILARLEHPNIARLLDGGTTESGLPYFVMEYVEGERIDGYCDTAELALNDRLRLCLAVCSAVQYAHRNLVIHRDLKPANILVTGDGTPKLLDFGIATLLDLEGTSQTALRTLPGLQALTPDYASPEQVRSQRITTASDVYSLGVLFYELWSGVRPYRLEGLSPTELERTVCEQDPRCPSEAFAALTESTPASRQASEGAAACARMRGTSPELLKRGLRGDLDNIVLTAMRKEAEHRYASVEQLAGDIQRHLEGHPVAAAPATLVYKTSKFIRRHRLGVAASALVAISLVGGIAATAWQARLATRAQERAERRFEDVRALANSLLFKVDQAIRDLPGATAARELVVAEALEYLDSLAAEAGPNELALQEELADAYQRVGDILGHPELSNLGNLEGAFENYQQSLTIREALLAAEPTSLRRQRSVAEALHRMATVEWWDGDTAGALERHRRVLSQRGRLLASAPEDVDLGRELAESHAAIGRILAWSNESREAIEHDEEALAIRRRMAADRPQDLDAQRMVASSLRDLGGVLGWSGDLPGAIEKIRESLTILEAIENLGPPSGAILHDLATTHMKLGENQEPIDPVGALASYRRGLAMAEALAAADPRDRKAARDLSIAYAKFGDVLLDRSDSQGALESYRKALAIQRKLLGEDPTNAERRRDESNSLKRIGDALFEAGRLEEARRTFEASLVIRRELHIADPGDAIRARDVPIGLERIGDALLAQARRRSATAERRALGTEALESYREALAAWRKIEKTKLLFGYDNDQPAAVASSVNSCQEFLAQIP